MPTHTLPQPALCKKARLLPLVSGLLFVLMTASSALAQTFSGLSGTVLDASKASVKGAKVTVTSLETGTARVATTSSAGFYSFPDLLVGHYSVRVEAPGFQSENTPGVTLDAAVPATVNFSLKAGDVSTTVDVEAIGAELDQTTSSVGGTFDALQLATLPINDRNYMRFAQLSTGSTLKTSNIFDFDFDGVGLAGSHFFIDGVDDSLISVDYLPNGNGRGARLENGSQEAISEFHILGNGYNAEYGRASAAVINVISKGGTNHYHGEAYDYFRNEALDSRNFFSTAAHYPEKPRFRANDFGGNFGGPIYKDKTFFFANYEGTRQFLGVLTSGTVLSSTSRAQTLAAHPALATFINEEPVGIDSTVNPQVANYSTSGINAVSENTESVRVDHNFSAKDSLFARYNFNQAMVNGPQFAILPNDFGINQLQQVGTGVTNIAVHEQHIFSPRLINDVLIGFDRYNNDLYQNSEGTASAQITGLSILTGGTGENHVRNNGFQYGDAMTLVYHQHTLKFGATFYRIQLKQNTLPTAQVYFTSVSNFIADTVSQVVLSAGDPGHQALASEISSYIQDSWQARPNLSINYGVRWDVETTPHDSKYSTASYSPQLGTLFPVGHQYYPTQLHSFGPRLGVAYALTPRTVIRAGSGLYFQDPTILETEAIVSNNLPGNETLTAAGNPGLTYPYTSFTNGTIPTPTVYGYTSPRATPFNIQYNASVSRDLGRGIVAQVAYVGLHTIDMDRLVNYNEYAQHATVRPNPTLADAYVYQSDAALTYNSLQAQLKGKFKTLSLALNYTWAHDIDNSADIDNGTPEAQDYTNLAAERGDSTQDQRENFNYNLIYEIPMGQGHSFLGSSSAPLRALATGWSINSLGIFTTGVALNVTQSINTYGNSDLLAQRPNLVPGVPRFLSKSFDPATGGVRFLNPAAWTYPATGTFGNSPRDPIHGPHFTNVDFSLKKTTQIHDNQHLDFRAEIFNILNHPNFAAPVVAYAPTSLTFGESNTTFGSTVGFGTSRQIQLSLKYIF